MQPTAEQKAIIESRGNIKINAVAGSGKTTTLVAYARARPGQRILYLAFNKSVKTEALKKFAAEKMGNVTVETAHSLAFHYIIKGSGYTVKKEGGYKTTEVADILGLEGDGHTRYILASHINKLITCFCNSDKARVQQLDYESTVSDTAARQFVKNFKAVIEKQARIFLAKMDKQETEVVHDFYLKKFQQSKPVLPYDCILFDEGQDASEAMLDVFLNQPCTKVIVGDTHQQIYAWRYAVNSLEKVDFPVYGLTTSFRFSSEIASLATRILQWKQHYSHTPTVTITGMGGTAANAGTRATLARSNSTLLVKAIEMLADNREVNNVYFEGRFETYTYADEGASLYDVLNLYLNNKILIRDKLIASLQNMAGLQEYIEKTEDRQLGLLAEVVKKYGDRLPGLIKKIKDAHIEGDDKSKAGMIFSTVHKCKGMEYGTVTLAEDFITEEKIKYNYKDIKINPLYAARINEEINILYVAVTRTLGALHIPHTLMPQSNIHIITPPPPEPRVPDYYYMPSRLNTEYERPQRPAQAGQPWKQEEDEELTRLFCEGKTVKEIAKAFNRTRGAVESRIKKLELRDIYGIE